MWCLDHDLCQLKSLPYTIHNTVHKLPISRKGSSWAEHWLTPAQRWSKNSPSKSSSSLLADLSQKSRDESNGRDRCTRKKETEKFDGLLNRAGPDYYESHTHFDYSFRLMISSEFKVYLSSSFKYFFRLLRVRHTEQLWFSSSYS